MRDKGIYIKLEVLFLVTSKTIKRKAILRTTCPTGCQEVPVDNLSTILNATDCFLNMCFQLESFQALKKSLAYTGPNTAAALLSRSGMVKDI